MMRSIRLFGSVGAAGALVAAVILATGVVWRCGGSLQRALWVGQPLLELRLPEDGSIIPQGGLVVHVTYPSVERVASETFRCELNGEDVTARVAVRAENGVDGAIFPLREGKNLLKVGVFGRSVWGTWVEDVVEIEVHARPLESWDRA